MLTLKRFFQVDFLSNKASFPLKIFTSLHNYGGDKFMLLETRANTAAYCTVSA